MKITSSDIAEITNGRLVGPPDLPVTDIVTDSRQLSFDSGQVFFAIVGKNHDGHYFIDTVFQKGIKIFVVERLSDDCDQYKGAAFILTNSTVDALQLMAAHKRKAFKNPVIAITGSAGKTIVKEWLADILGITTPVLRSPRSYNSQIGVALSVWKLEEKYQTGIFEAGISMRGEMDKLRRVIEPDIGLITNIGDAHSENFTNNTEKAAEKLVLFKDASLLVYCSDHKVIHNLIRDSDVFKGKRLIDWSFENPEAGIFVITAILSKSRTAIKVIFDGVTNDFEIAFSDRASIENAVAAIAVCLAVGTGKEIIAKGLSTLGSVAMRMEMKNGINNCQLIEDYYNSDPGSLGMAIEFLNSQKGGQSILILSDFLQNGRDEKELYGEVATLISKTGINKFIGIGTALIRNMALFDNNAMFYYSTDEFVFNFNESDYKNSIILIKGARIYEFEKIGQLLEQQVHQTMLEVNLDAISHNLNEFRRHLDPETRIMAMVKAFAYGAGPAEIASLLEYHRVDYLAVSCADEGVELRNGGVTLPVVVMNPDPSAEELLIRYNLEPEIFSFSSLETFSAVAAKHGLMSYPVHIKIDTGMHRLGFMPEDINAMATKIKNCECIRVISVFSHLAASEDPVKDYFSRQQADVFLKSVDQIRDIIGYSFLRHILNSSGIIRMPQYQFEMVRPGIGLYGVGKFEGLSLKVAGSFKTRISQIKKIRSGETVGYSCADVSDKDRLIAILPVGYADGLNRKLGNRNGSLFINGQRVKIIGNICMDMCMADISEIQAEEGDEAEIFGVNIPIDEIAEKCHTIPYEILTSIPGRVKRVFFRE